MRLGVSMIFAAVLLAATRVQADTQCHLLQAASVDMTIGSSGRIVVPMTIGGRQVRMMIDTGSPLSLITFDLARSLNLNIKHADIGAAGTSILTMFGGLTVTEYAKAPDVAIGALKTDSMGFGIYPGASNLNEIDGLLGADIMQNYDLDFDFAHGKFNLFSKDHCNGAVVYWTRTPVAVVPFSREARGGHFLLNVQLDGKTERAIIDTGATRTVGTWEPLAEDFGLSEKSPGVTAVGSQDDVVYRYAFKTLTFGGVTVSNPDITMIPRAESGMVDMSQNLVIGINVLRQLHLYVATGEEKFYITPASAH